MHLFRRILPLSNTADDACPQKAHAIVDEKVHFLRENCTNCGKCCDSCYVDALVMTGKEMSVSSVLSEIKKDDLYYKNSGGGVTFSGGEPLLQINFLKQLLIECKKLGYHTAIETAGHVPFESFLKILPYTDLFLYDIKIMNDTLHNKMTSVSNLQIIDNLKKLSKKNAEIYLRTPLIPGINDSTEEMTAITEFVSTIKNIKKHEFLPYNSLGESKYKHLGLTFSLFK